MHRNTMTKVPQADPTSRGHHPSKRWYYGNRLHIPGDRPLHWRRWIQFLCRCNYALELDQACYVIVFTFQGSGEVPTTPGTMQSWSSGPFLPGSSWDPITVSVPYVNSGPGATAWTILVENLCFIQPGIVATGVIGLDGRCNIRVHA
jgi:hypothetical protein